MPAKREIPNIDNLIREYLAGKSLKQISVETGIARTCLGPRFEKFGVELRSRSEAERLKWSHMDRSAIVRQCSAAWGATRGREHTTEEKILRAVAMQRSAARTGRFELELLRLLEKEGIAVTHQLAFGPYNIDVALHRSRIAVEIYGVPPVTARRELLRERTESILNEGWVLINALMYACDKPSIAAVGEQVIAVRKQLRRDKSLRGKYWVIRGNGEPMTSRRFDFDGVPRIDRPRSGHEHPADNSPR